MSAEGLTSEKNLIFVECGHLKPSPMNDFDLTDIDDMKASILSVGLITPLTVIGPDENQDYCILSGCRRYKAICELLEEGMNVSTAIPCNLVGETDMDSRIQMLIINAANIEVRDLVHKNAKRFEIVKLLKELVDDGIFPKHKLVKEAGKYMGVSDRYRRMYVQIFDDGSEELIQMVSDHDIPVHQAARLSSLPKDVQDQAIKEVKAGSTTQDVLNKYISTKKDKAENGSEGTASSIPAEDTFTKSKELGYSPSEDFGDMDTDYQEDDADFAGNYQDFEMQGDSPEDEYDFDNMEPSIDLNVDVTGLHRKLTADSESGNKANHQLKIQTTMFVLKKLLSNDSPSEDEWEVIELARQVAERFL